MGPAPVPPFIDCTRLRASVKLPFCGSEIQFTLPTAVRKPNEYAGTADSDPKSNAVSGDATVTSIASPGTSEKLVPDQVPEKFHTWRSCVLRSMRAMRTSGPAPEPPFHAVASPAALPYGCA